MRLNRVHRLMTREEINGILLLNPFNIRYLTGFKPSMISGGSAAVLAQDNEPWLVVPKMELELAKSHSWVRNIHPYQVINTSGKELTLLDRVKEAIEGLNLTSVVMGIEFEFVSARRFETLKRLFPDAGFKDVSNTMAELRMVKDEAEIERLKTAVQIAENGIRTAIEFIRPGITEIEVAAEVESTIRKAGATQTGYPTVIAAGARAVYPYAPASRREIGENEFVVIGISADYDDYCSNLIRTVITGKPDETKRRYFECARDGINSARNLLGSGTHSGDVVQAVQKVAEERGFQDYLLQRMGNSIGLQPFEPPFFSSNREAPILPGMVFTIETGLYHPELGGIRLSDTLVHQKNGIYQILNQIPIDIV